MKATIVRRLSALALHGIGIGNRFASVRTLYACVPEQWRASLRRRLFSQASGQQLLPVTIPSVKTHVPVPSSMATDAPNTGVNLYGYVHGEFGLAENMRVYARALVASGYPTLLLDAGVPVPGRMDDHSLSAWVAEKPAFPVDLCFVNPDLFAEMASRTGVAASSKRHTIGFWLWELERVPETWQPAVDMVDEIWVPNAFVRAAFQRITSKPVVQVPPAIDFDVPQGVDRRNFGLSEGHFIFLFSFDFHSYFERKNPLGVIAAFRAAFPPSRTDVRLVIKSTNGDRFPAKLAQLIGAASRDPRIICHDAVFSRETMFALLASVDAYVSLHRAEGIGFGLAESMYLGRPVVATGYSGNLDFMNAENSRLVGYRMVDIRPGEYPGGEGQQWADPDIGQAADCMRSLADNPLAARALGELAAKQVRERLSPARCAAAAIARLEQILLQRALGALQDPIRSPLPYPGKNHE